MNNIAKMSEGQENCKHLERCCSTRQVLEFSFESGMHLFFGSSIKQHGSHFEECFSCGSS